MSKKSESRRFAVGFIVEGSIVSIPLRRLTFEQADVFQRVHNGYCPEKPVVLLSHQLSPAVLKHTRRRRAVGA
jgi:hypothetical protein